MQMIGLIKALQHKVNGGVNCENKHGAGQWAALNNATNEPQESNRATRAKGKTHAEEVKGRNDPKLIRWAAHRSKDKHEPIMKHAGEGTGEVESGHQWNQVSIISVAAGASVGVEGDRVANKVAASAEALLGGVNTVGDSRSDEAISNLCADLVVRVLQA